MLFYSSMYLYFLYYYCHYLYPFLATVLLSTDVTELFYYNTSEDCNFCRFVLFACNFIKALPGSSWILISSCTEGKKQHKIIYIYNLWPFSA